MGISARKVKKSKKVQTLVWEYVAKDGEVIIFPLVYRPYAKATELVYKNLHKLNNNYEEKYISGHQVTTIKNPQLKAIIDKKLEKCDSIDELALKVRDYVNIETDEKMFELKSAVLQLVVYIDMDSCFKKDEIQDDLDLELSLSEELQNKEDIESLRALLKLMGRKKELSLWEYFGIETGNYAELTNYLLCHEDDETTAILDDDEIIADLQIHIQALKGRCSVDSVKARLYNTAINYQKLQDSINAKVKDSDTLNKKIDESLGVVEDDSN